MKTSEAHVMKRLLTYMWRYKWLTALALAFTFLTSLLLTAIPLAARWYIDHLVDPTEAGSPIMTAFQFAHSLLWLIHWARADNLPESINLCACIQFYRKRYPSRYFPKSSKAGHVLL